MTRWHFVFRHEAVALARLLKAKGSSVTLRKVPRSPDGTRWMVIEEHADTSRNPRRQRARHRRNTVPRGHRAGCRCIICRRRTPATRPTSRHANRTTAAARYQRFHGRAGRVTGRVAFAYPKHLVLLGRAVSVVYVPPVHSGKFFRTRTLRKAGEYLHKFGSSVKLYTTERGDAVILLGGKFRVTDWLRG